ncbi:MAG: class I SAM-dependent rRNA methyltransferase [Thermodesulfovibrionales bacterium]
MKEVTLKRTSRLNEGHLWIFSNEIASNLRHLEPGEIVYVVDKTGKFYGTGYVNPHSLIAVRLLSRQRENIDREFFFERIKDALSYRRKILRAFDSYRLIHSEGDLLPGLIVDIYANCMVIQILTAGMERLKDTIISTLDDILHPDTIILRNDSSIRKMEGLPLYKTILKGSLDTLPIINDKEILTEISPLEGQKTGAFLDQRFNRQIFVNYLSDRMLGLDLFCYSGSWGLNALKVARHVTFVDDSALAIEMTKRNLALNNWSKQATVIRSDVFEFLKENKIKRQYDFIIIDPPAFVKTKDKIREAIKGYREINSLAMESIKDGGIIATSSCSYHISRETFLDILRASARDVGRFIRIIEFRGQAPDHPILLSVPETQYLKCIFLEVVT